MKKLFPGFYTTNLNELVETNKESVFIFDTNVLLNLFRYPDKPREMLLKILKGMSEKIWIPYQVGMEYHYNVIDEIVSQDKAYDGLIDSLNDKYQKMRADFEKFAQRHTNLQMDEELLGQVKMELDRLISDLQEQKSQHPKLYDIQEELSRIIGDKVGEPYTEEELKVHYENADKRYDLNIPPGFKDANKGEEKRVHNNIVHINKYGDFILWRQVLDHFIKAENKKKSIFFITDDTKSDWFKKFKGIRKPHPELFQEFRKECGDSNFNIYTTKQFLKYACELPELNVDKEEIDEVIKGIDDYKKKKDSMGDEESSDSVSEENITQTISTSSIENLNDIIKYYKDDSELKLLAAGKVQRNIQGDRKYSPFVTDRITDSPIEKSFIEDERTENSYSINIQKIEKLLALDQSIKELIELLPYEKEMYYLDKLFSLKNEDNIDISIVQHKKLRSIVKRILKNY